MVWLDMVKNVRRNLAEFVYDWVTRPADLRGCEPTYLAINIVNFTKTS
jgi:hypothetical protein